MNNNINNKTSPNQMRVFMKRIRENNYSVDESNDKKEKNLTMRDMLKITRRLNEAVEDEENKGEDKITAYDLKEEEKKFLKQFENMEVIITMGDLIVRSNLVFWSGVVHNILQFTYKITLNKSGVKFKYDEEFSHDNPIDNKVVEMIESYYENVFYPYWKNNVIE